MKRFDFAAEVAKQLITISSAFVTVVIAFYEKFFSKAFLTFTCVIVVLILFVLSVLFGVASLGGLVNLVGRQERADKISNGKIKRAPVFVGLARTKAQEHAMNQQICFALGLIVFILVALFDRALNTPAQAIWE